jgi:3-dehydroquinate synthase
LLNFGHTFAHGIETAMNFKKIKHGEAVAIGLVMAARLSVLMGLITENIAQRVERLVSSLGLPVALPSSVSAADVVRGMEHDKKFLSGAKRFIVFDRIGQAFVKADVPMDLALTACKKPHPY